MNRPTSHSRGRHLTTLLIAIALGFSGIHQAQAVPDMTEEEVEPDNITWNLGPTGMRGWIPYTVNRDVAFTHDARQILVIAVAEESPADGIIHVDDVILGVNGQKFDSDARMAFGNAITEAEREANSGELQLLIWRDGDALEATVPLEAIGSYSDTSPWDCEKSQHIIDAALEHAANNLTNNIPGRFNALALIQSGREEYQELVQEYFRNLGDPDLELTLDGRGGGGLGGGYVSWSWGHALVAMAEYHLATGDDYVLPAIKTLADTVARGQSDWGTWGHVMAYTREYHMQPWDVGLLGGYGALNNASQTLHYGLVLSQLAGVENDNIREAIEKSSEFFRFYVGKGSIPYGDHAPWHRHSNNGKNALAALMFNAEGDDEATKYYARMTTASYSEREHGHTGPFFSLAWGPLGAHMIGRDAVVEFLKPQRWYYDLARQWDGSFQYQGRGSYRGWDMTGVFLLTYMLSQEPRLDMTGRNRNEDLTLSEQELKETLDAGRGFTLHDDGVPYYDERSVDQLLGDLTSWSPTQRGRAAAALGRRSEADAVPKLIEMLESDDLHTRLGATAAIKALGPDASEAVEHLENILKSADEEMWLRAQASEALANLGEAAYPAVPTMLRVAGEHDEDDPRQMLQRYVASALFGTMLSPRTMTARDIDRQLLFDTVEAILSNPDGATRRFVGFAGTVYDHLEYDELRPILPSIVQAVRKRGKTGIMFSDGIRLDGLDLLSRNHVREGIPLCLEVLDPGRWGYGGRFNRIMNFIERYEGAAEPLLPALRKIRDDKNEGDQQDRINKLISSIESHYEDGNIPELRSLMDDLPANHEKSLELKEYLEQLMQEYSGRPEES